MPHPAGHQAPGIVFDLESLLLDTAVGVRHALLSVAQGCRASPDRVPEGAALRTSKLSELLAVIAGTRDLSLISDLAEHYWRVYEQDSRYRAPLLRDASALLATLGGLGAELHYVSTLGPQASVRLVHQHGLNKAISSIYTPPAAICPGARAKLLENFIQSSSRIPDQHLVLSDGAGELYAAQRLGIPALALGYGATPLAVLESLPGLTGIAPSPSSVGDWLQAGSLARRSLQASARRESSRLH